MPKPRCSSLTRITLPLIALTLVSCASPSHLPGVTHPSAQRYEHEGLAVEFLPAIDRITFFGPVKGPNLLYTRAIDSIDVSGSEYRFFAGAYTWISPQSGVHGWIDPTGQPSAWPPDPAMDFGPAKRTGRRAHAFTVLGPRTLRGLREEKTVSLVSADTARLEFTLINDSDATVTAGTWTITALRSSDVIAVRMPEGIEMYGWDERSTGLFTDILGPMLGNGWRLMKPSDAKWDGGAKVYWESSFEIAIWSDGYWLHRRVQQTDAGRLRDHGEGPVAIHMDPSSGVFEAELYGPLTDIEPGRWTSTTEEWRVIKSPRPDPSALP